MATRNTRVLRRIIKALGISPQKQALQKLEEHFANELLLVADRKDGYGSRAESRSRE